MKEGHRYLFEYHDRPPLDLGWFPPPPPPPPRKIYVCPGCSAEAPTPKRCRPCNLKMKRTHR